MTGPGNIYNQNGFQFQDWNNNIYNNCGGRGGCGCGGHGGHGVRGNTPHQRKYCWTHGLTYHNGRECNNQMQGHQPEATVDNCMGEGNRGCRA